MIKRRIDKWTNALLARGIKTIGIFDFDVKMNKPLLKIMKVVFIFVVFGISMLFLVKALYRAHQSDLWLDERNGLSARNNGSYYEMVVTGLGSQVSKHPLDYIGQKLFDQVASPLMSMGVSRNIYYRLNSIFYSWVSGLCVVLMIFLKVGKRPSNYFIFTGQMVLLLAALLIYYFWPFNFFHTVQMRPYALWNALWLAVLAGFLFYERFKWPLIILLILLAATAGAAFFQLGSLAAGFLIVKGWQKDGFIKTIRTLLKVFTVPLIVSLYYIWIDHGHRYVWYSDFDMYMKEFFQFWLAKEMIPILSGLGILMTVPFKELRNSSVVFLAMLILYLVSPLMNYLVLTKGVFFSSRHYLYYDLIYPVFLANLALILPYYWDRIKKGYVDNCSGKE